MANKKNKGKDGVRKKLSKKDAELWKAVTSDVERMPEREYAEAEDDPGFHEIIEVQERIHIAPQNNAPKQQKGKEVDRATLQKFTRGKMAIEATIDLHGMNQSDARDALGRFIRDSHTRGRRCVLVITGKGLLGRPSVLKGRVPEWLSEAPLEAMVLKIAVSQIKHGGEGAFYVLLRRDRG